MQMKAHDLAVIGAGNMAEAIVRGILSKNLLTPGNIIAADTVAARRAIFANDLGIETVDQPIIAARNAGIILLSVKPQQMIAALQSMSATTERNALYISIAAGVKTATIEAAIGGDARVVRAMPNTPMLVSAGMTAICRGLSATADDLAEARRLFESAGRVVEVDESQMEAVTAVSGSGPAYIFYLAEQMIAAGIALGLSEEQARMLTLQTIEGSGKMLASSKELPASLRAKVTSPGGTTQAAIEMMDSLNVGRGFQKGIIAAAERGKVLGGVS